MDKICAIILAAGDGTRMKSNAAKVLSNVLFRPMLQYVIDAVQKAGIKNICVVTGFKHEEVEKYIRTFNTNIKTVLQKERKGTAHAVLTAKEFLEENYSSDVVILGGDSPFVDAETIKDSYYLHKQKGNAATVISAKIDNPFGYGRIIRDKSTDKLLKIVEQKDATKNEEVVTEVNSGTYWFSISKLRDVIEQVQNNNSQNEYYLPDAISLMIKKGFPVGSFTAKTNKIVLGANSQQQLSMLNEIARFEVLEKLMSDGVEIPCTDGIMIGRDIKIGNNTKILPNTIIKGNSKVGSNCIIGPGTVITDCKIGDNVKLISTYCKDSFFTPGQKVNPFSTIINNKV